VPLPRLENLFTRADVTPQVESWLRQVPSQIERQIQMLAEPLPVVANRPASAMTLHLSVQGSLLE